MFLTFLFIFSHSSFKLLSAIIYCLYTAYDQLASKQTLSNVNPPPPPSGFSDILYQAAIDILQYVAVIVAVWFFRPVHHDGTSSGDSRGSTHATKPGAGNFPRLLLIFIVVFYDHQVLKIESLLLTNSSQNSYCESYLEC